EQYRVLVASSGANSSKVSEWGHARRMARREVTMNTSSTHDVGGMPTPHFSGHPSRYLQAKNKKGSKGYKTTHHYVQRSNAKMDERNPVRIDDAPGADDWMTDKKLKDEVAGGLDCATAWIGRKASGPVAHHQIRGSTSG
ncbi:13131_t:CDS:2, partial [Acaulospora colombiana]